MVAGRLYITCDNAINIRRKDQVQSKTELNPFLKLTLGPQSCTPTTLKTGVQYQSSQNPSFGDVIIFDIKSHYTFQDNPDDENVNLLIQLFDRGDAGDDLLGEQIISVHQHLTSTQAFVETVPLIEPGDVSSNSKVQLNIQFRPVMVGMLVVTLIECRGVMNLETNNIPVDTTLDLSVGNRVNKYNVMCDERGCINCGGREMYFHIDETNWFNDLTIKLYEHSKSSNMIEIGVETVSFISQMADPINSHTQRLSANLSSASKQGHTSKPVGTLDAMLNFLHGGSLLVKVMRGQNLRDLDIFRKINPYIKLTIQGRANVESKSSQSIKEGGENPIWEEELSLTITDHHNIKIECYDDDNLTKNDQLFDEIINGGEILLTLEFIGPNGVQFPRLHPSTLSKDDVLDKHMESYQDGNKNEPNKRELITDISNITEEEMRSVFNFLDLDGNEFIGASEIRHVLICMGELITDDEVDMMISMLDRHGDGQVNFQQLYKLVKSTDPEDELDVVE